MGKYSIQQLATILVKKNGLSNDDATKFVNAIFDIVKEGLETDKIVKIKGFGTFKIIDVDPRESVNVNTGERVLINGHQKITFTPDSVMKEMVNRPFAQFETVVLNDGVDFSDIDKQTNSNENNDKQEEVEDIQEEVEDIQEEVEDIQEETQEEEIQEEVQDIATEENNYKDNKDIIKEEVTAEETPESPDEEIVEEAVEEAVEEENVEETVVEEETEDTEEEAEDAFEEEKGHSYVTILLSIAACLLLMAASAYVGYLYGIEEGKHQEKTSQISKYSTFLDKQNEDMRAKRLAEEAKATKEAEKAKTDSAKQTAKDTVADKTTNKEPEKSKKTEVDDNNEDFSKYNTMDARVRTGAYVIVGIDKYVIVRQGQTVGKIASSLLGPGMSCYLEVLNGVSENEPLKEGTKIKIPKLRHKKAAKKK